MRKANILIVIILGILFLIHIVAGIFQLTGVISGGVEWLKVLTYAMMALIIEHIVIGIILTVQVLKGAKRSGKFYAKQNKLFLTRRISGIAVIIFLICHLILFWNINVSDFRLSDFGMTELILMILLVITLAVHVISNINPAFISFGTRNGKGYVRDAIYILAIVLAVCAVAFVVYYLRWNVYWR